MDSKFIKESEKLEQSVAGGVFAAPPESIKRLKEEKPKQNK
jgi:hypothetical protein